MQGRQHKARLHYKYDKIIAPLRRLDYGFHLAPLRTIYNMQYNFSVYLWEIKHYSLTLGFKTLDHFIANIFNKYIRMYTVADSDVSKETLKNVIQILMKNIVFYSTLSQFRLVCVNYVVTQIFKSQMIFFLNTMQLVNNKLTTCSLHTKTF